MKIVGKLLYSFTIDINYIALQKGIELKKKVKLRNLF